jgi:hypothetical protein
MENSAAGHARQNKSRRLSPPFNFFLSPFTFSTMHLYERPPGVETRWVSFESPTGARGAAARENRGAKGHPSDRLAPGETKTLLDFAGSGTIQRIWLTVSERSPEMLRSLRLEMFWDGAARPAVSCPLGDFFGAGLGRLVAFESALFSNPEGRSLNCFVPMPFRRHARVTLTNESSRDLLHLFYDIDLLTGVEHGPGMLYLHAHWRRESPNALGREFVILPPVPGGGRFLGCNLGVITNPVYGGAWWGEGEVKIGFGGEEQPTLCGTGAEDYLGTAWGQGAYAHRTQGCPVADAPKRHWAFYRHHLDDPVYFHDGCRVAIQTLGGSGKSEARALQEMGAPLVPVAIDTNTMTPLVHLADWPRQPVDLSDPLVPDGWCNFWRQDDWSATAYVYLESPEGALPPLAPVGERTAGLGEAENATARADT